MSNTRRTFPVLVRSPRAAFLDHYLTRSAAESRVRKARRRGWSARLVEADLVAVNGASLDPLTLPEPDPDQEGKPPPHTRRSRRRKRLDLDEARAIEAANTVDLAGLDRFPVLELDGDEDLDPWGNS